MNEQHIEDKDLSAWCSIFRNDKIELCIECYAATAPEAERITLYKNALSLCYKIVGMIEAQIKANPNDASFALIYHAFTSRNIAQIDAVNLGRNFHILSHAWDSRDVFHIFRDFKDTAPIANTQFLHCRCNSQADRTGTT